MTAGLTTDIRTDLVIRFPWVRSRPDVGETDGEPERVDIRREPTVTVEMLGGTATADSVFASAEPLFSGTRQVHGAPGGDSPTQTISIDIRNRKWLELKWQHFSQLGRKERIARALAALHRATISCNLDPRMVKWIAEDPDLEDF